MGGAGDRRPPDPESDDKRQAPEGDREPVEMEESTDYEFVPDVAVADGDVVVDAAG